MSDVDTIMLNFSPDSLMILNVVLAAIMFGVALDMRAKHFLHIFKQPFAPVIGLLCQFVLLPAATFLITWSLNVSASLSLGLMLVAACPGGNISNFFTNLSGGNTALSVIMSSVSTFTSIVMTPLNFSFWGSQREETRALLETIALNPADIVMTVLLILIVPTILGVLVREKLPLIADKLVKPMKWLSLVFLACFVGFALSANFQFFLDYVGVVFLLVLLVNTIALTLGFSIASLFGLSKADRKAVTFETGIQNSGFGLILIFNFFGGLGGMALVAAWWGIWHLLSGIGLATFWSRTGSKP